MNNEQMKKEMIEILESIDNDKILSHLYIYIKGVIKLFNK